MVPSIDSSFDSETCEVLRSLLRRDEVKGVIPSVRHGLNDFVNLVAAFIIEACRSDALLRDRLDSLKLGELAG